MNVRVFSSSRSPSPWRRWRDVAQEGETARKAAPARVQMQSTEVCHAPAYIRERAPEGLCAESADVKVDDDLSPLGGIRAYRLGQ